MAATLRKNVVERMYVVHCLVSGVGCKEFVRAECDSVARNKALANLERVYEGVGEYQIVSVESIEPESTGEDES